MHSVVKDDGNCDKSNVIANKMFQILIKVLCKYKKMLISNFFICQWMLGNFLKDEEIENVPTNVKNIIDKTCKQWGILKKNRNNKENQT